MAQHRPPVVTALTTVVRRPARLGLALLLASGLAVGTSAALDHVGPPGVTSVHVDHDSGYACFGTQKVPTDTVITTYDDGSSSASGSSSSADAPPEVPADRELTQADLDHWVSDVSDSDSQGTCPQPGEGRRR